jgi:hypothetical protein
VKTAVESLRTHFKSIQIEEIHETDWIIFKEAMISHFSLTDYNLTVAVVYNGELIGGSKKFLAWASESFGYADPNTFYTYETMAENRY